MKVFHLIMAFSVVFPVIPRCRLPYVSGEFFAGFARLLHPSAIYSKHQKLMSKF